MDFLIFNIRCKRPCFIFSVLFFLFSQLLSHEKHCHSPFLWWTIDRSKPNKTHPPLVTVAMTDKQCRSHTTHHVLTQWKIHRRANRKLSKHRQRRQSRLLLIWNKVSGPSAFKLNNFKEIQTINTVLWLFNVSWQITVSVFVRWRHTHKNQSAFWVSPPFVSYQSRGVL